MNIPVRVIIRELDKKGQYNFLKTKAAIEYGLNSGASGKTIEDIWAVEESQFRDEDL